MSNRYKNNENNKLNYNLNDNYITSFNLHLKNLKNNSDSIISDLCILETL